MATFRQGGGWGVEAHTVRGLKQVWYLIRLEFFIVRGGLVPKDLWVEKKKKKILSTDNDGRCVALLVEQT